MLVLTFYIGNSQNVTFNPGVDIMSRYIWRGLNLGGSSPSIQPSLKLTAGKFDFGTWGAFSTGDDFTIQETDLFLTYNPCDAFSLTVTDYFLMDETAENNHYFEFNEDSTRHVVEAAAIFNGTEKIPFTFMATVNFWGADARHADSEKQYSTYLELGYTTTISDVDCKVFIGGTINDANEEKGETGYYANSAGITNIGITANRKLQVTEKLSLPLIGSFIINPKSESVYLVIGLSL